MIIRKDDDTIYYFIKDLGGAAEVILRNIRYAVIFLRADLGSGSTYEPTSSEILESLQWIQQAVTFTDKERDLKDRIIREITNRYM